MMNNGHSDHNGGVYLVSRDAHADRQVRWCDVEHARRRARRHRHPRGRRAQRPAGGDRRSTKSSWARCSRAAPARRLRGRQRCSQGSRSRPAPSTINRVCGSALKAIMLASAEIRAGDAEVVVAGGMESMNMAPYYLLQGTHRLSARQRRAVRPDRRGRPDLCRRGLPRWHARRADSHPRTHQSRRPGPVRPESHQKAIAAIDAGRFEAEIVPVPVRNGQDGDARQR